MNNTNNLEIAIGEKIKSFRKKREITQEQLAEYLNISFQSVSKWECGDAYPDITMLPKIALFFGITTDELLCIDKLKEQEDIDEYDKRQHEALSIGHTEKAVAIMREANAKYPGNFRVMKLLTGALSFAAYAPQADGKFHVDWEYAQNIWKEIISIGEKIRAECKDDKIRRDILEVMTNAYNYLGEKEKAKKLINENLNRLWISQERMLEVVLEGEELIKQRQTNLLTLTELCGWEMYYISYDFKPEERITVLENILKIYSIIFTDGDYGYYHIRVSNLYIDVMNLYLDLGNNAKVFENLKKAAELSSAYDNLPAMSSYTSPLINKMEHGRGGMIKSYKGNQTYYLLKNLENEKYNSIRDTPEFTEICENLKQHAKEDE